MSDSAPAPFIPFAQPSLGEEEVAAVVAAVRSGWLTSGPRAAEFERQFAAYLGAEHTLAVNSATAGLHLGLEALGIEAGDRVAVPTMTFTATAEVVRYLGAEPVFIDVEPDSLNIDPRALEQALEQQPCKAIIPVHFGGLACDMHAIGRLAQRHGARLMSDAAHAFPAQYQGRFVGALDDDVSVFSFYANKTICTGEGGMVATHHADLAQRMRVMRLHGIDRPAFERHRSKLPAWYYEVVAPGYKYNMPDLAATIGIEQLAKAEALRAARQRIAERYTAGLADWPLQLPPPAARGDLHAWHLYVIQLELERLRIDRDRFIELLSENGIGASVHYIPLHMQPYWRQRYQLEPGQFPVASHAFRRIISLPIYPGLSDRDVERVIAAIRRICRDNAA